MIKRPVSSSYEQLIIRRRTNWRKYGVRKSFVWTKQIRIVTVITIMMMMVIIIVARFKKPKSNCPTKIYPEIFSRGDFLRHLFAWHHKIRYILITFSLTANKCALKRLSEHISCHRMETHSDFRSGSMELWGSRRWKLQHESWKYGVELNHNRLPHFFNQVQVPISWRNPLQDRVALEVGSPKLLFDESGGEVKVPSIDFPLLSICAS